MKQKVMLFAGTRRQAYTNSWKQRVLKPIGFLVTTAYGEQPFPWERGNIRAQPGFTVILPGPGRNGRTDEGIMPRRW